MKNIRLKAKIVERYGTQADFALRIDVDESIVSRVICGRRTLPVDQQAVWAKALGCSQKDLFSAGQ